MDSFCQPTKNHKIAVIGAGLAGLTVAYRLFQKGYSVNLYEARGRVGGRVHSVFIKNLNGDDSIAELGGQNITDGAEAGNLCSLAKELAIEIRQERFKFIGDFYDGQFYHDKETIISPLRLNNTASQIPSLSQSCRSMKELLDKLLVDYPLQKRLLSYMLRAYEGLPPQELSLQPHNLKTLEHMILGGVCEAHSKTGAETSLLRATLKGGNATLPCKLHEKLASQVHFAKILNKVILQNNEIMLHFSDNTISSCNQLILAIPCSVFEDIHFDNRLLNTQRLNEMMSLQYGLNAKIILPINMPAIKKQFIFSDNFGAFTNFDKDLVTLCFSNIQEADLIDFKYYDHACAMVKKGFNNACLDHSVPHIPDDIQFKRYASPLIKAWSRDPFAKASYSAYGTLLNEKIDQKIQYRGITFKKIFAPIEDRIFFVGEHATLLDEVGTMEAAVESGERLAKLF